MSNDIQMIKLMQHFSNALKHIANAISTDDRNPTFRYQMTGWAKEHLKKFDDEAELLLNPQPNEDTPPQLNKHDVMRRFDDEKYDVGLAAYLKDGINYSANTIGKADEGDLEQLAADSYFAGYRAAVERFQNGA